MVFDRRYADGEVHVFRRASARQCVCDEGTANFSCVFVSTNRKVIMDATDCVASFSVFYAGRRSTVAVHTRLCETNWETKNATKSTQSANCTFTNT